jgi:hypothetical protein
VSIEAVTAIALSKFVPTAVAAAAIGFSALMTVGAPLAHASAKSDCEGKGGTYTETTITDNTTGKIGTSQRCCVKDAATNTTSCTTTTTTNASRNPFHIGQGVITAAETDEPVRPIQRVPLGDASAYPDIQAAP